MSFSSNVKDEICAIKPMQRCCILAELKGILLAGKTCANGDLKIVTKSLPVIRKSYILAKTRNMKNIAVHAKRVIGKKTEKFYQIRLDDPDFMRQTDTGYLKKIHCKKAFIRGVFLSSGSITDPNKGYHLEMKLNRKEHVTELVSLLEFFHLKPGVLVKKKGFVVYLKEGEDISDLLKIVGASRAIIVIENVRILKEMHNNMNRVVNCEAANLERTIHASIRQIQDINFIKEKVGFESLPDKLSEIARLRLENQEANLTELGNMLNPPLGKSGVNHRLKKLEKYAKKLSDTFPYPGS